MTRWSRRWAFDERGQLGGVEAIPFGLLVLVVGALLVTNAWGVIDAKLATEAAAREAARAYVEAPDPDQAVLRAKAAADEAMAGYHRMLRAEDIDGPGPQDFVRCRRITYTVRHDVPTIALPWIGGFGGSVITATAQHSEIVDPYRSWMAVGAYQGADCGP